MNLSKVDITECVLTSSPVRESLTPDESNIDVTDQVQTNPPTDNILIGHTFTGQVEIVYWIPSFNSVNQDRH